eukprot:TRINITY_DN2653_c0_g1_i2.p1 TRINITY_DN2653_c0_g1~~TRINITY_DN2653_c0_g1_i2.p1  ORF type:complete len:288 (-),score=38.33 TRINITY_DN2653_c0_g1_i2:99-962(-)
MQTSVTLISRFLRSQPSEKNTRGTFQTLCCPFCHGSLQSFPSQQSVLVIQCDSPGCKGNFQYSKRVLQLSAELVESKGISSWIRISYQTFALALMRIMFPISFPFIWFRKEFDLVERFSVAHSISRPWTGQAWATAHLGLSMLPAYQSLWQRIGFARIFAIAMTKDETPKQNDIERETHMRSTAFGVCQPDALFFSNESLQTVISSFSLNSRSNDDHSIAEIRRVLEDGGILICNVFVQTRGLRGIIFQLLSNIAGCHVPSVGRLRRLLAQNHLQVIEKPILVNYFQ